MHPSPALEYLIPYQKNCQLDELLLIHSQKAKLFTHRQGIDCQNLISQLPMITDTQIDYTANSFKLSSETLNSAEHDIILNCAKKLIPWRKGPFDVFNINIDAEWRSDQKWQRLGVTQLDIQDKVVLDIGCNNGYYMFKMAQFAPRLVLGIDPIVSNWAQFNFIQKYAQIKSLHFELFGVEHLKYFKKMFDTIFSMGIIYHHKDPLNQLIDMKEALKPGGTLILETIGIAGDGPYALFPQSTYTKMKNIWFFPTKSCLINWVHKAKFKEIDLFSACTTTEDEQRLTDWCPPPITAFKDYLDPQDNSKTIEGYPAPVRFCLRCKT